MTRLTPRKPRRGLGLIALAAAGTVALSGCNTEQAKQVGAAAVIGGNAIPVSQLQDATQAYVKVVPDADTAAVQRGILQQMVISQIFEQTARNLHVAVSDGQVAERRDQLLKSVQASARQAGQSAREYLVTQLGQSQQPTFVGPQEIDRWIRDQLLLQKISAAAAPGAQAGSQQASTAATAALVKTSRKLDVQVNPRYGTWNPRAGITPEVSGGLAQSPEQLNQPAKK
jgi:hypothetical protein